MKAAFLGAITILAFGGCQSSRCVEQRLMGTWAAPATRFLLQMSLSSRKMVTTLCGSGYDEPVRADMTLKRMDNVLIVVEDLEAAKAFFIALGLTLEGETTVEGPSIGKLIGLKDVRATLAMMRTPDGQGIELDKFHTPNAIRFGPVDAPVNTLGIRRVMFAVDDMDTVVAHMLANGAELIGEMQYEDTYRLAYIRGPEGIIVGLAEQFG